MSISVRTFYCTIFLSLGHKMVQKLLIKINNAMAVKTFFCLKYKLFIVLTDERKLSFIFSLTLNKKLLKITLTIWFDKKN